MTRTVRPALAAALSAALAACAGPGATSRPAAPARPLGEAALRSLQAREGAGQALRPFAMPDGRRGQVLAAAAPTVVKTGAPGGQLSVPIGAEARVACTFSEERLDAGAALTAMLESIGKGVRVQSARLTEVAEVDGRPMIFAEVAYLAGPPEAQLMGVIKLAVRPHPTGGFICEHDEVGYARTFRALALGLAGGGAGALGQDPRDRAAYAELHLLRLGGLPVGYAETVMTEEAGGPVTETWTLAVFPRSATDLVMEDGYQREAFDPTDLQRAGAYVTVVNGEPDLQLALARREDGRFAVRGKKSGKALEAVFDAPAGLAGDRWFMARLRTATAGEPVRHAIYSAEADPLGPTEVSFVRTDAAGRVELRRGPMVVSAGLGRDGLFDWTEAPLGATALRTDRVWSRGTP